MSLLRHLIFAFSYAALAVAVALTLPYSVTMIDKWTAVAIGALVLVLGILLHEIAARIRHERQLRLEIQVLAADRDAARADLADVTAELSTVRAQTAAQPDGGDILDRISAEKALLEELVRRLSARYGPDQSAAAAAQAPLSDAELRDLVHEAVREDRIDITLQPIVSLPQRKTRHFEVIGQLRTAAGATLEPEDFQSAAEAEGLNAAIDNILLFRSIQLVRETLRRNRSGMFFTRLSVHTLGDAAFMAQLADFMADNAELAPRLVFQFGQDPWWESLPAVRQSLDRLASIGFRFALSEAHDLGRIDADVLHEHHIRFLKIDADRLLAERDAPDLPLAFPIVKDELDRVAVDLIANRVRTEQQLVEILDVPIDFGQGPLLGDTRNRS